MKFSDVVNTVLADRFQPFRIHLEGGRSLEVRDSSSVYVGRSRLTLSTFFMDIPDAEGPWFDIPLSQIESLEPIPIENRTKR